MMTHETVRARRKAGIALVAGLVALGLSMLPFGRIVLLLRLSGLVGVGLSFRWAIDGDHPTRRKVSAGLVVVAMALQVQNLFRAANLGGNGSESALGLVHVAELLVQAILLLGLAFFPRAQRRRTETALLWTGFGASSLSVVFAVAMGLNMVTNGELVLRTLALVLAFAAGVMLLIPARQVVTEDEAWVIARVQQGKAAVALKEAATAMEDLASTSSDGPQHLVQAVTPAAQVTRNSGEEDLMALLDARLAKGDLTEESWKLLRAKYERIAPSKSGQKPPI